ncbi:hypothetical protein QUF72_21975 [Desulfobacterales bacterium HSG2]|nr:hypothetical protein [Desulfobacterales bacterium HSG2]
MKRSETHQHIFIYQSIQGWWVTLCFTHPTSRNAEVAESSFQTKSREKTMLSEAYFHGKPPPNAVAYVFLKGGVYESIFYSIGYAGHQCDDS